MTLDQLLKVKKGSTVHEEIAGKCSAFKTTHDPVMDEKKGTPFVIAVAHPYVVTINYRTCASFHLARACPAKRRKHGD